MKRKNNGNYMTTRNTYKAVKKYDHAQFDAFCTNIYKEGYRDGADSVPGVDIDELTARLETVKGIGTVKLAKIKEAVEELFAAQKRKEGEEE